MPSPSSDKLASMIESASSMVGSAPIAAAAARVAAESIVLSEKDDEKYMDLMRKAGIKVFTYTDKELEPLFKRIGAVTWDKMATRMGKDLIDEFKKQYAK